MVDTRTSRFTPSMVIPKRPSRGILFSAMFIPPSIFIRVMRELCAAGFTFICSISSPSTLSLILVLSLKGSIWISDAFILNEVSTIVFTSLTIGALSTRSPDSGSSWITASVALLYSLLRLSITLLTVCCEYALLIVSLIAVRVAIIACISIPEITFSSSNM